MAWNLGDEVQIGGGECNNARYVIRQSVLLKKKFRSIEASLPGRVFFFFFWGGGGGGGGGGRGEGSLNFRLFCCTLVADYKGP